MYNSKRVFLILKAASLVFAAYFKDGKTVIFHMKAQSKTLFYSKKKFSFYYST